MNDNPPTNDLGPDNLTAKQAADLIRLKIDKLYDREPDARAEAQEASTAPSASKHQQFMRSLTSSGKDFATIQTEWHNYYTSLPETEKKQVWQEFYASSSLLSKKPVTVKTPDLAEHKNQIIGGQHTPAPKPKQPTVKQLSSNLKSKVSADGKLKVKHHLQSIAFGLGIGFLTIFVFLFTFFNQVIISPFIQPSRTDAATPVIIDQSTIAASSTPEVIIPKINVEIPVDYNETSTDESVIENDLEDGVVHYPTTVLPGQIGNAAFFGHSSNNIFNPGKYKFAFVLLHTLVPGDTFYLTYNHTLYIYKVISKNIVSPNDVSVLGPVAGQTATATLITCDPPGTSINRLVVVGQQISPNPSTNTQSLVSSSAASSTTQLPGNGPSLWSRLTSSAEGKITALAAALVIIAFVFRWLNRSKK